MHKTIDVLSLITNRDQSLLSVAQEDRRDVKRLNIMSYQREPAVQIHRGRRARDGPQWSIPLRRFAEELDQALANVGLSSTVPPSKSMDICLYVLLSAGEREAGKVDYVVTKSARVAHGRGG